MIEVIPIVLLFIKNQDEKAVKGIPEQAGRKWRF